VGNGKYLLNILLSCFLNKVTQVSKFVCIFFSVQGNNNQGRLGALGMLLLTVRNEFWVVKNAMFIELLNW